MRFTATLEQLIIRVALVETLARLGLCEGRWYWDPKIKQEVIR